MIARQSSMSLVTSTLHKQGELDKREAPLGINKKGPLKVRGDQKSIPRADSSTRSDPGTVAKGSKEG